MKEIRELLDRKTLGIGLFLVAAVIVGALAQFTGTADTATADPGDRDVVMAGSPSVLGSAGDVTHRQSLEQERKQVTRYSIDLEVEEVKTAMKDIQQVTEDYAGFVDSSSFSREHEVSGRLTVRIPEENATAFLDQLGDRWRVESRRKDSEDVTDRFTELRLELKNKRQELRKLEELMNQTNDTGELIRIQERMSEVRSRVQFLKNQMEELDRQVEYTRISISLEEPQPFSTRFELQESFRDAYRGLFQSLNLMIVGLGYLFPFLLAGGIIYKGRNLWREVKGKE